MPGPGDDRRGDEDAPSRLESLSDAVMAPARERQARRAERLRSRWGDPRWQTLGLGLAGLGLGSALGSGDGNGFAYGCIGLILGVAIGLTIARVRR